MEAEITLVFVETLRMRKGPCRGSGSHGQRLSDREPSCDLARLSPLATPGEAIQ